MVFTDPNSSNCILNEGISQYVNCTQMQTITKDLITSESSDEKVRTD